LVQQATARLLLREVDAPNTAFLLSGRRRGAASTVMMRPMQTIIETPMTREPRTTALTLGQPSIEWSIANLNMPMYPIAMVIAELSILARVPVRRFLIIFTTIL